MAAAGGHNYTPTAARRRSVMGGGHIELAVR